MDTERIIRNCYVKISEEQEKLILDQMPRLALEFSPERGGELSDVLMVEIFGDDVDGLGRYAPKDNRPLTNRRAAILTHTAIREKELDRIRKANPTDEPASVSDTPAVAPDVSAAASPAAPDGAAASVTPQEAPQVVADPAPPVLAAAPDPECDEYAEPAVTATSSKRMLMPNNLRGDVKKSKYGVGV